MSNDGVCSEPHTSWTQETCHSKRSSPGLATHLRRHSARHSTSGMACCPVSIKKADSDQEKRRRKRKRSASKERAEALLKTDRKSTRLNSSHGYISYAVFCLKKKKKIRDRIYRTGDYSNNLPYQHLA